MGNLKTASYQTEQWKAQRNAEKQILYSYENVKEYYAY